MDSVISIKTSRAVLSFEKDFDDIAAMRRTSGATTLEATAADNGTSRKSVCAVYS